MTERANAFVAARLLSARAVGRALSAEVMDPELFARVLLGGLADLADPEYLEGQRRVAPGIGSILGVRWPLIDAMANEFRRGTRAVRPAILLSLADRLFREAPLEVRWYAFGLLDRLVGADPERSWQLMRRAARESGDWITVDTLAGPYARGVLLEAYRWAELEQLVYSPSRWERRLVGSTIARIPFVDRGRALDQRVTGRALALVADLIGDAEPDVQKALSWALRSLSRLDGDAVAAFASQEAAVAVANDDGHRAWVIRDMLPRLASSDAARLRRDLSSIRRRSTAPPTSRASETAERFGRLPDPATHPEPPLGADQP